jgi:signal transduction histidine kinase
MSGYPPGQDVTNWGDYIDTNFRKEVAQFWEKVYRGNEATYTTEWLFANGRWVTAKIIRMDKTVPGLTGLLGTAVDITERKQHEEAQRLRVIEAEDRRIEAEEAKRQQELLIDITSHEIRNPISSLMQCSSLVKTNLLSLQEQLEMVMTKHTTFTPTEQLLTTINEDLEALESIYQCGLAQERISNDVLSLGRRIYDMKDKKSLPFSRMKQG